MKNKHQGLINIIIFCMSIAIVILYGFYQANQIKGSIQISSPAIIPQINVPDPATLAYIDFLNQRLADIAQLKPSDSQVDLSLFGFDPNETNNNKNTPEQKEKTLSDPRSDPDMETVFSYHLTLCLTSPSGSFCSIDGKLYKENATLPDGAKIIKIENDRVSISNRNRTAWIYQKPSAATPKRETAQQGNEETK